MKIKDREGNRFAIVHGNKCSWRTAFDCTGIGSVLEIRVIHNAFTFGVCQEFISKSYQPSRRNFKFDSHGTVRHGNKRSHFRFSFAKFFDCYPLELFRYIDHKVFEWLHADTLFFPDNYFRSGEQEFKSLSSHVFSQNPDLQFTTTGNLEGCITQRFHTHCNVRLHLFFQPVSDLVGSNMLSFCTRQRSIIDGENNRECRFFYVHRIQCYRVAGVTYAVTYVNIIKSCDCHDISRFCFIDLNSLETFKSDQF